MAGLIVADTDVVIDFLRGRGPGARLTRQLLVERCLRLTSVTGFELRVDADFLARRDQILRLFRSRTLALDLASALRAGEIAASLQKAGSAIGLADCLQAGGLPAARTAACDAQPPALRPDRGVTARRRRWFLTTAWAPVVTSGACGGPRAQQALACPGAQAQPPPQDPAQG
jgi:tRNA(fMet)-specific endonuclease VapC